METISPLAADQVKKVFDTSALSEFASKLGLDDDGAAETIAETLPEMVDKSSSGGSLLDAVGGIGGALNMAKKLFS